MKLQLKNNFKKVLLDSKVTDYRELYAIVAKRRTLIPSFSIMVMGLHKDKLVFYKVSTSYKLIKFIESIELKDINEFETLNNVINNTSATLEAEGILVDPSDLPF